MQHHEHDLTRGHVPMLVRRLAVPAAVGFLFHTLYNVVDTYFAGTISTDALAALSIGFPVFFAIIAVSSGSSVGATALIANALGAGRRDEARLMVAQSLSFGLLLSLLVAAAGLAASPSLFRLLGAEGGYLALTRSYMDVIFLGTPTFVYASLLNAPLSSSGNTRTFRNALIAGCLANVVLDPWFIFGGWGLPAMGLPGVAWSTVLIEMGICVHMVRAGRRTGLIGLETLRLMRPRAACFAELARQALPASLNMLTVGLGVFIITWFVSRFGKAPVAAYGVATRIEQIVLLPVIGLNMAALAIVGQNFGARQYHRIPDTLRTALRYGFGLMLLGGVGIYVWPETLMRQFTVEPEVVVAGAQYLRVAALTLCAYVVLFVVTASLQGMRKPMFAVWIGLYRQLAAPMLVFPLLAHGLGWGLSGIWWGIFIVTWSGAVLTLLYARRVLARLPATDIL